MKKLVIALIVILLIAVVTVYLFQEKPEVEQEKNLENGNDVEEIIQATLTNLPSAEFIQCLADSGVVIYGSTTCPYCKDLVDSFGGYGAISPLYVECNDDMDRCVSEMRTEFVPEIQMNGEVLEGVRKVEDFVEKTGCEL